MTTNTPFIDNHKTSSAVLTREINRRANNKTASKEDKVRPAAFWLAAMSGDQLVALRDVEGTVIEIPFKKTVDGNKVAAVKTITNPGAAKKDDAPKTKKAKAKVTKVGNEPVAVVQTQPIPTEGPFNDVDAEDLLLVMRVVEVLKAQKTNA